MELHSCFQYPSPNVSPPNGFITEKIILFQRGSNIFQWGWGSSSFQGGGVQILIFIEPHITCDFGGRGPDPYGSAHKHRGSNTDRNSILNMRTD